MARSLVGTWTAPGKPLPSSHLIYTAYQTSPEDGPVALTRCGRQLFLDFVPSDYFGGNTPEPPANAKTCERCAILSRRDG